MACQRCFSPDHGAQLCPNCEAEYEHEQNLDDDREFGRPRAEGYSCWFAQLPDAGPCEGRLVKCHLIPQQQIKLKVGREFARSKAGKNIVRDLLNDPRCFVYGCGGAMGPGGHHGAFKPDGPRPIPRSLLPPALERFAEELGIGWYLDRTFGPLDDQEEAA